VYMRRRESAAAAELRSGGVVAEPEAVGGLRG
jgi:hypothetical protein